MKALLRDTLQLVKYGTSSTRARPATPLYLQIWYELHHRKWRQLDRTRVTYRPAPAHLLSSYSRREQSRLKVLSQARCHRHRGVRSSAGVSGSGAGGCTSGIGSPIQEGMAQHSTAQFNWFAHRSQVVFIG